MGDMADADDAEGAEDADDADDADDLARRETQARAGRPSRPGGMLALLLVVTLGIAGVVVLDRLAFPRGGSAVLSTQRPTAGYEMSAHPRGSPPPAPARGGPHRFLSVQDDGVTPVAYDPCRRLHYVVRPDHAPPGGQEVIRRAVARVSVATGLRFVFDGATDEEPSPDREPFQPDRYGDRWAPVLISWVTAAESPDVGGDIAGQAGSLPMTPAGGTTVYVTGSVELDADDFAGLLGSRTGRERARAIVLHELGHLVGLDHVDDRRQLMYPTGTDVLTFRAGDLAGLNALGRGACQPAL